MLAWVERHLLDVSTLTLFAAAQLADLASTMFIFHYDGIHEANPISAAFLRAYGPLAFIGVKMTLPVIAALVLAAASRHADQYHRGWVRQLAYFALLLAAIFTIMVVTGNLLVLYVSGVL